MNAEKFIKDNLLVKMYAGSIAYGTNLPTSDVDFRGIFCADPVNILTPFYPVRETVDSNEEDTKHYEMSHFFKLCLDCNPNIVELLWTNDEDIVFRTPAYDFIREHRADFLSSKIAFTTTGYAFAQLKKIKSHNKWVNDPQPEQPPQPKDFVSLIQYFGKDKMMKFNIGEWNDGYRFVPYGSDVYGIYEECGRELYDKFGKLNTDFNDSREDLSPPKLIVKFNKAEFKIKLEHWKQYWEWKVPKDNKAKLFYKLENEIFRRNLKANHAMHLV